MSTPAPNKGGRPRTVAGKQVMVYLSREAWQAAHRLGAGNVSAGIRIALAGYGSAAPLGAAPAAPAALAKAGGGGGG